MLRTPEQLQADEFPNVSLSDLETVEQVACWLGAASGQQFLNLCEEEIDIYQAMGQVSIYPVKGMDTLLESRRQIAASLS